MHIPPLKPECPGQNPTRDQTCVCVGGCICSPHSHWEDGVGGALTLWAFILPSAA